MNREPALPPLLKLLADEAQTSYANDKELD
jgi:hypothetical protein